MIEYFLNSEFNLFFFFFFFFFFVCLFRVNLDFILHDSHEMSSRIFH